MLSKLDVVKDVPPGDLQEILLNGVELEVLAPSTLVAVALVR